MAAKRPISKLKTGAFARGMALLKTTVEVGARSATHALGGLLATEEEATDRLKRVLTRNAGTLAKELGRLKGSAMKVGQLLSTYGEHFLPPEANRLLKSLQQDSPPLAWEEMERVLRRQLGPEKLPGLEIDPVPLASASLGQVHPAVRKSDGRRLALKIQYPGVDQAIESDLKSLRSILNFSNLIPRGPNYESIFKEVREMLHHEVDYERELEATRSFGELLRSDPRYRVPEVFPEYSAPRVLCTSREEGLLPDDPAVQALPQERRDALGAAFLDLYLKELFEFRWVQTDPHFGNYRIQAGADGHPDRLVLFDFGAMRKLPKGFVDSYKRMVKGAFLRESATLEGGARELGFLQEGDSPELRQKFIDLCYLITEPFTESAQPYDWGASDLPKRVAREAAGILTSFKLRVPPREIVFIDRKMGGVFIFLSVLKARVNARALLLRHL